MRITVNGEDVDVDSAVSVDEFLARRGVPLVQVAVELNGKVVRRAERASTMLNDGDVVEIVTLVGGG